MITSELNTGAMVAFIAPFHVRKELRDLGLADLPCAVCPDYLHITLVYMGNAFDLTREQRAELELAVEYIAARHGPFNIRLGGFGKFIPKDEYIPFFATIDTPGLGAFQTELNTACAGITGRPSEHGFVPHMTLGYLPADYPHDLPNLDNITLPSWTADSIALVFADKQKNFNLRVSHDYWFHRWSTTGSTSRRRTC